MRPCEDVRAHCFPVLTSENVILAVAYRETGARGRAARRAEFAGFRAFRVAHDDEEAAAALAVIEADFVLLLERAEQVAGMLKGDLGPLVQAQECLVRFAERLAEAQLFYRSRRRGGLAPQQPEDAEEGGETRGF